MTTERRVFRPFDLPPTLGSFLDDARLLIAGDSADAVEPGTRHRVDASVLHSESFVLELTRDDESLAERLDAARDGGPDDLDLVAIVSSSYLKIAEVVAKLPLLTAPRLVVLDRRIAPAAFRAIHHGCDIEAYVVIRHTLESEPLQPWRKGTWLSRVRFELRTELDGVGFDLLPLTDDVRNDLYLHEKTMRHVSLDESPLHADPTTTNIAVYVDDELLSRLNRSPRRGWAKGFTDQLAVDVLSAIAVRALIDEDIRDTSWSNVRDTLLGSLIAMVGGRQSTDCTCEELLDTLRKDPLRFQSLIEGTCEMRDAVGFIMGNGS